ncbi:hypothetical protein BGZ65_008887 [Modicella reniformis]|uniref:DUF202 domain-containing protein n=1 Tax=Modicella reniformis TaxID=1440133 RepID=A0A9P6MES5_9FUNG|nr:hypothetical protein BGZ65_008887 [Modicella reniformis]
MNDQKFPPLDLASASAFSSSPLSPRHPLSPASVTSNVTFHDSVRDRDSQIRLRNRLESKQPMASLSELSSPTPNTSCASKTASTSTATVDDDGGPFMATSRRLSGDGGRILPEDECDENNNTTHWRARVTHFLKELYDKYSPSLTLENKGSIARDHLANERTYLAWLRSSLSLITVGVAITQLFRLQASSGELDKVTKLGRPLGGSFVALGILFLWLGTARYFHSQNALSYGQFPASRGSVIIATVTVMAVLLACFIIVILQGRTT